MWWEGEVPLLSIIIGPEVFWPKNIYCTSTDPVATTGTFEWQILLSYVYKIKVEVFGINFLVKIWQNYVLFWHFCGIFDTFFCEVWHRSCYEISESERIFLVCAIWKGALKVGMLDSSNLCATIVGDMYDLETGDLSPDGSNALIFCHKWIDLQGGR